MRLVAVIIVIFLMIAAVGQSLYWVTTRSGIQSTMSHHTPSRNQVAHRSGEQSTQRLQPHGQRRSEKESTFAASVPSPRTVAEMAIEKKERPSLKFKKVRVMGRMASPRLDFTQEQLPVERVDEPVRQEFFQRVFVPVGDYSF